MKKLSTLLLLAIGVATTSFSQNQSIQKLSPGQNSYPKIATKKASPDKPIQGQITDHIDLGNLKGNALVKSKTQDDGRNLPLNKNGKLISVEGGIVDFEVPSDTNISNVCYTPSPKINGGPKDLSCSFVVPCDNAANRDAVNTSTIDYFQVVWHVMWDGGASSNIDQATINALMAELNADYAAYNMIFCADPANFYEDATNYYHDENTEEFSLKASYVTNPTNVINIYVVGQMGPGGYARFPYDPNGGTSPNGGIVLNRGNCSVGTHTLAHEMGHTFGLAHTFSGVDEKAPCSSCYEKVRNINGSSNTTGVPTPIGGPYTGEGDREGDWCSDTHPHDTYSYNCSTSSNANGVCDLFPWANAPVNNHMSYSFCSTTFTDQQGRRMHCMTDTYLSSWIAYGGGLCGAQPPVANFVGTPTTWQAPSNVNFTDLSAPTQIITGWTWTFDVGAGGNGVTCAGCVGGNATFVGQTPPTVTYPNPGLYTVSLTITSPNGNDTETKVDYILVNAPAGDCDTLTTQWETPTPTVITYGFGGGWITGVQDPVNSINPTDGKGVYERYFSPNPGTTPVGAVRVGLGSLNDLDDDMTFQVVVYDDDGFGAPGAVVGGVGGLSPTQLGVPGVGFYNEFWVPFLNAPIPTTGSFHVGVEIFPGDATDTLIVMTSCLGPTGCAVAQGENDASNHIFTSGFGYENLQTVYGADFDVDIIPMLGEWDALPVITGFTETVNCDTTIVQIFDTAFYAIPSGWSFTFSDGFVVNSATDPGSITRTYTTPGPDTVVVSAVNDCGRGDTTTWIIPYNFMATPDADFVKDLPNPICIGDPVTFTANSTGMSDYSWDMGDGTTYSGGSNPQVHTYTAAGLYYASLSVTSPGYQPMDTTFLEDFEGGIPVTWATFDNDGATPNAGVNPPFTGSNATAWLPMDFNGTGDNEAYSTSWNVPSTTPADDWLISPLFVVTPGNSLSWDGEAQNVNFSDGYEVYVTTGAQTSAGCLAGTMVYSTAAENSFTTNHVVDLSAYGFTAGTARVCFRNNSTDQFLLAIDNVRVGNTGPGCSASITKTDFVEVVNCTVNPPVAALNADVTTGCAPQTVNFTDVTTLGDPATSWLWNFGDGNFSTLQNPPPHVYTGAGTYFVSFEACNAGGCSTDYITINIGLPPTISNVTTTDPTCAGNDGSIVITATGGTGTLQYSIDNGVTFQASNTFNGLTDASYDIVVEDSYGCQTSTTVTLNPSPTPNITNVATVDPTCNGGTDGTITITASGGTGALQYSIDNGVTFQPSNAFTGLSSGLYNIVVEDASGCQATTSVTLNNPPAVVISNVNTTDPSCNGGSDGQIVITASGGTGALQYSINNGVTFQAGSSFPGLIAGSYNIVVEDANGCQATTTATLTAPPAVSITNVTTTDPTCNGDTDGQIVITASGGTGALSYSIDNGVTFQAGNTFTGLGAGTYNIVVEDASGCQATTTATLTNPPIVSITNVTSVDPQCNGGTDGSITITASGGTGALSYSIDNGVTFQAGNNFTGLGAGTFNIVVEDANGCQVTSSVTLTPPPAVVISNVTSTDPTCNGATDGSITITASGGTGALSYSIDNGVTFQAGNNFTGLGGGTYNIVVEDANGCQATSSATLTAPSAITISNVVVVDPTCNGGTDGSITITASGGTGALTYSVDNGVTFQASNSFTGLGATGYNIVVEDASGCQATTTATLTDPPAVTFTDVVTDENCGAGDGTITLTGAGGDGGPYNYSIDNGVTFQGSGSFTGLSAGSFNVVVEDASGCQTSGIVTVNGNGGATISGINEDISLTCNGDCNGQLTATVVGGVLPYVYSWVDGTSTSVGGNSATINGLCADTYTLTVTDNGGAGCPVVQAYVLSEPAAITYTTTVTDETCGNGNGQIDFSGAAGGDGGPYNYSIDNGVTFQGGTSFTGLSANSFNVVVEDGSGCQSSSIVTVNNIAGPNITLVSSTDPTCGGTNGTITITASGGTGALQYSIDNGVTFQGGNNFTGLGTGTFNIVVEDANGCQATSSVTLTDPGAPSITNVAFTDPSCNGAGDGTITITASGGTGALQYSIDNGVTFQAGNTFSGLNGGTYNIVVEDAAGCQTTSSATLTEPPAINITNVAGTDPTCGNTDGTITITASGGTGALQYSIDNGVTFQAGNIFASLGAGTFNIVVEDANGCQQTSSITLNNAGAPTITNVVVVDPTCGNNNGSITITASGGAAPLSYSIDNGVTFQAGNSFSGLGTGTYDIVVEDNLGCQATTQVTLTDLGPPTITGVITNDPTCGNLNGDITINASGGTGALQYSIDNGVTFQAGNNFTGLGPASYTIVVEDANGCQVSTLVTLTDPGSPVINVINGTDPSCGNNDGQIDITASGGTGALQYSVDNGVTFQAGNSFTGLGAGTYNIVVEDANGCQVTGSITLNSAGAPTINSVTVNDPTCGNNNGSISINATGGTPPLTYSIDNGVTFQAGNLFTGLSTGTYDIVVEDGNGCQAITQVTLTDPGGPAITNTIVVDPACGNSNGSIDITATGSAGPLQYSIDNGVTFQAGNVFTGLNAGSYDVVVEDANGCQVTVTLTLTNTAGPSITNTTVTDPTCGNNDGSIDITASGGTGALQYSIDNGVTFQAGNVFNGLGAGSYTIVVEDANGCQTTSIITLNATGGPILDLVNDTTVCGSYTLPVITGTNLSGNEAYYDGASATGTTFAAGASITSSMTIFIYDSLGTCNDETSFIITIDQAPDIADAGADQTICDTLLSANLSGNTPAIGSGTWSLISGSIVIDDNLDPMSSLSGIMLGTNMIEWSISNGTCPPSSDTVMITVETCAFVDLVIPNGFTPDGNDNVNATWDIQGIDQYPDAEVKIFNKWGSEVFSSKGYTTPWDGTYNNNPLPVGTYYYVINLNDGSEGFTGSVTIIK